MKNTTKKEEPANNGPIYNRHIYDPYPYGTIPAEIILTIYHVLRWVFRKIWHKKESK